MALKNIRENSYPDWYQNVIAAADMAEVSSSPGCMVIKPWGYGIWERIQRLLDEKIKETNHENCYFPLFIPLSYFQKEAEHVEGFAKEMAIVTHSRLSMEDGKLVPASPLEEPLIVRPTSETIIADSFSKWVHSYRDLPVMINQCAGKCARACFCAPANFCGRKGIPLMQRLRKRKKKPKRCSAFMKICASTIWLCR